MRPRLDRRTPTVPDKPALEPLVTILELVASGRPAILPWLLSVLDDGPEHYSLVQLTEEWGLPLANLSSAAELAAADLDRLEASPQVWIRRRFLRKPHVAPLVHFAAKRGERVSGAHRRQRLRNIRRRLERDLEFAERRRKIDAFLGSGCGVEAPRVDRDRIEEFLRR